MTRSARVCVIGGGIAGLAAAWELVRLGHHPVVVEREPVLGGKIRTSPFAGRPAVDEAADAFLARVPEAVTLAGELGLGQTLVTTAPDAGAFVSHGGRLHRIPDGLVLGVPAGIGGLARSRLLSTRGKARAALDLALPGRAGGDDDSLGAAIRRRFGDEVLERLVDPLVGSINAGDADELSLEAAVPQIAGPAMSSRSLILALRRRPQPADGPVFLTPSGGMASLVAALAGTLEAAGVPLLTGVDADALEPDAEGRVLVAGAGSEPFDAVVLATPVPVAARLLWPDDIDLLTVAGGIPYAGVVMVAAAITGSDARALPFGTGYLVPKPEQRHVTAVSFASRKWPHWRHGDGSEILRISLGRHRHATALGMDDDELVDTALDELAAHTGLATPPTPLETRITRWPGAFPQYLPHHTSRVERLERAAAEAPYPVALAGAGYRGIGIPACIRSGRAAAGAISASLRRAT